MYEQIKVYCVNLIHDFHNIPDERKNALREIANFIQFKKDLFQNINLLYLCTHNSRRSVFGQVWSQVAAFYYNIGEVFTFSGGTEITKFNFNAINALENMGFLISSSEKKSNPNFSVNFGENLSATCFSKIYDDFPNPTSDFAAIMMCSDADRKCPIIKGSEIRFSIPYDDPKVFDNSEEKAAKYRETSKQIAIESLFIFSLIK